MSVFNGECYLCEAVESILDQSFCNFEFIIIDDGSTDGSAAILNSYLRRDCRVQVYRQQNSGLIESLNRGLQHARGKYIARMDADDIAIRERLMCQVEFMEDHPELAVLGGAVELINAQGKPIGKYRAPVTGQKLKSALLRDCALSHPTVLMRSDALASVNGYREVVADAEDWDLWLRIAERFEIANLEKVVLKYRLHASQITVQKCRQQALSGLAARASALARRSGKADELDSAREITPALLARLGVSDAAQQAAVTREYLRSIRNMYEAGEYSIARRTLVEALHTVDFQCAEKWVIGEIRLLAACLDWHERRFGSSIQAVARAIIARPKMIARPLRSLRRWLRLVQT
jgi:hypothetical protein